MKSTEWREGPDISNYTHVTEFLLGSSLDYNTSVLLWWLHLYARNSVSCGKIVLLMAKDGRGHTECHRQMPCMSRVCSKAEEGGHPPLGIPLPTIWARSHWLRRVEHQHYLLIVDAYSKWIDIFHMGQTTTTKSTIKCLLRFMSSHGIPTMLVLDNGPQFTASEFAKFCQSNGIDKKIPPYHPASNGQVEHIVQE